MKRTLTTHTITVEVLFDMFMGEFDQSAFLGRLKNATICAAVHDVDHAKARAAHQDILSPMDDEFQKKFDAFCDNRNKSLMFKVTKDCKNWFQTIQLFICASREGKCGFCI